MKIGDTLSQTALAIRAGRSRPWIYSKGEFVMFMKDDTIEKWLRLKYRDGRCSGYKLEGIKNNGDAVEFLNEIEEILKDE